jgi:CheY-like chemotaxis protein
MDAVGRLAGGVAHDFNNLLTVVKSNLSMIKGEHCDKCPHAELLNEIGEAAERATELTGRLLAFSRQNIDKIRACDLTELVLELRRMLTRVIGEDILIEIATSGHSILCQIDRGLFEQMLVNLAVNARDAMPRGGVFRLTTGIVPHDGVLDVAARDGMVARISASDTGGGIERENLDRIFEPFFTTKEVGKGTGLGLAMAYGVVKQHGGEIQVRSEVGQGTTFEIHLPLCEKRTAEPAFEPTPVKVAPGRSPATAATILLVEDEASVRRVTKRALEKIGHRVIEAVDPEEALASANNPALEFDLVLSDIVMPGMNGLDLMTRIKEIRPGMKSLFMSGYAKEEILSRISTDSSIEYLPKPFTIDELAAKIKGVLEKG